MGRQKRILHVIPSLDRAGSAAQLFLLAPALPRDRLDVHVCALRGGPLEDSFHQAGIPVTLIGKRWPADPQALWQLRCHVARLRPDLVHGWRLAANSYGYAAARAAGVRHVVATQRCVDPGKGWLELAVDRYLARHCQCTVANSPGVRDFHVRHGLPAERFRIIPNGVPASPPSATSRSQIIAELCLPAESRLIGLVGGLWPHKRVKDAIWAADLLKVIRDDVHLLIIGEGTQRPRLVRFRDQVEIADKVHFLGSRSDVPRLMPHFDVLWSTSSCEGQSNAILEAMAAGVPVVATDIPGTRDLVVPGATGYLVAVGHRAGIARWTNQLLDDPALAERMGQAGRVRAEQHFSLAAMVLRYVDLYRELLTW